MKKLKTLEISKQEKLVFDLKENTISYTVSSDGVSWDKRVTFKRDISRKIKIYTCPICRTRVGLRKTCPCCGCILHP